MAERHGFGPIQPTVGSERMGMNRSLAFLLLLPLGGACSSDDDSKPAAEASDTVSVSIADFMFTDAEVQVSAGGSVEWTNTDDQAHTATSAGNFDAGAMDPQRSATVVFPTAGTFTYICSFHPFMTGTVVVD